MALLKYWLTANALLSKVRWLQSKDDEPAVEISSVAAVLSLTMQPGLKLRTDYAKWITGIYFCCAICSAFQPIVLPRQMRETFWVLAYSVRPLIYEDQSFLSAIDPLAENRPR